MKQLLKTSRLIKRLFLFLSGVFSICLMIACYQLFKPIPKGLSKTFPLRSVYDAKFLADYTYITKDGQRQSKQEIFDEILRLIKQAKQVILIDMFLFNDFKGEEDKIYRKISGELTRALIDRKKEIPQLNIIFITDPFNTLYGSLELEQFQLLKRHGVQLVFTDLRKLRDSNPSWSSLWRLCFQWFGNNSKGGWLPSPVSSGKVTIRSYLNLLNFKANHRKTMVVDYQDDWMGLVTSANPHDGSSAHTNVAIRFKGEAAIDLMRSELAVVKMSNQEPIVDIPVQQFQQKSDEELQILTEADIRDALIQTIDSTEQGDDIEIAVFYFSHRGMIQSLLRAHQRNVKIKILMDPNKDAFGREKNGIPNRQVALELTRAGIPVRWCDTHGEQCHTKMTLVHKKEQPSELILGSANYTRRNIDDFNLETSIRIIGKTDSSVIKEASDYFLTYWNNLEDKQYSIHYEAYEDPSNLRYWQYRLMEFTGWSTF